MRINQSPCRTRTNKPVKMTLTAMQLATRSSLAEVRGNNGGFAFACRALWNQKGHHRQIRSDHHEH